MAERYRRPPNTPPKDPLAWVENTNETPLDVPSQMTDEGHNTMTENSKQEQHTDNYKLLDSLSTCIQIADADFNITFMNKSLKTMFAEAEADIRKDLPQFNKDNLIGMNMDLFHKNPSHQRGMMSNLKSKISSAIEIGGRHFSLSATPMFEANGQRSHIIVEWVDMTAFMSITSALTEASKGNLDVALISEASTTNDTRKLRNATETLCQNIRNLITDANMLSVAAVEGRLSTRADASKHQGDFRKIVEGVNNTLDAVINPLNVAADYVDNISKGAIPAKITDPYNGDFNVLKNNLNTCIDAVNMLVSDAGMLSIAAVEGRLATRADATKHQGDFRKIVEGVNNTLDAVINPLNVTADYVEQISKGIIPPTITNSYNGDFNIIKNNLNNLVKMMSDLLAQTDVIIQAAANGELDKRANAELFQGGWKQLVSGVNETITNIVNPLNVTAEYVDNISKGIIPPAITTEYKGQYNVIKNNLNNSVKMMSDLLAQTDIIIQAAENGELNKRANAELFQGGWKQLVSGVNETITNIVNPLNVAADYVNNISKGTIPAKITETYKGDFNIIKNNLNTCIDAVNSLVSDANMLSIAAVEGRLSTRADATKHQGDFRRIVEGVNDTLDAVIAPLNSIAAVIDLIGNNDLSANLSGEFRGDFALIKDSLENALQRLNTSLYQIVDTVDQVSQSAEQLSNASHNMAATSEQQSSAVEEVTSAIEETDSQVRANTDNANAANQLVMSTSQAASQGQQKMQAMSEAMSAINDSSQSIAKIIKVIDEIAFQTNLLALNAAVEAARAGQHGRGFAVVAQEVRNLAGRSAKAARETADLIEDSTKRVKDGVNIAGETGDALDQIVTNVIKVKDLVAEIATASVEQSRGVSQINVAMGQVAAAARSGSKQAEELSSASTELTSIAGQTKQELGRFKLRERQINSGFGGLSLENLSPELLRQLQALLAQQMPAQTQSIQHVSPTPVQSAVKKSPKQVMPLDQDERGFEHF